MKSGFVDRLVERMDQLDSGSLQTYFLRLAREKGLLETIFQALQEGIIVLDSDARIGYANRAAEQLLGFRLSEAEGEPIRRYLQEIEWDLLLDLDEREWSRLMRREIEIVYPRRRFVEFYVVPLSVVDDREEGAVVIFRDVTRERRTTAEQVESERLNALSLLAAGVAHEIGNPLNSIHIHLQLMAREIDGLEDGAARREMGELLEVSRREVERLDAIIKRFLQALRPSPPQRKRVRLPALVGNALETLRHEMENRRMLVETEFSENVPNVLADATQVRQAFFNVVKNALQAMSDGGILKISVRPERRFVAVVFEDNGPGIDPDKLGAVCEPYHTTKPGGTGLGMMIVQRIVRDHGGELEIDSDPGRGTRVVLRFPREDAGTHLLEAP